MEPWFVAKEIATILGYDDTTRAINRNVDEEDQKLLSCNECKSIFGEVVETLEIQTISGVTLITPRKFNNITLSKRYY